jgi:FkbM family methyltransferase
MSSLIESQRGLAALSMELLLRPRDRNEVADADIADEVLVKDQYRLSGLSGLPLGVVVDVGAHIGCFSRAALVLHSATRIEAYEPDADNFAWLTKNLRTALREKRARCHQAAVSGHAAKGGLHRSGTNSGAHRAVLSQTLGEDLPIEIRGINETLDSIPEERIGVVKLDCEGSEYSILATARSEQLSRIDLILMELHLTPALESAGERPLAPVERLHLEGFRTCLLEDISYPDEGRFWVVAAVNQRARLQEELSAHYQKQAIRYTGATTHRLRGWLRSRLGAPADLRSHLVVPSSARHAAVNQDAIKVSESSPK